MADSELTDLTEATSLAATDLLYAVVDPAGTPLDRKATVATVRNESAGTLYAPGVSGRWYRPAMIQTGANGSQTLARMYARPIRLGTGTIDRIAAYVAATVTASEVCRLGIYANGTDNRPGALVVDGGTIDLSASGNTAKSVTVSAAVTNGVYWLVAARQGPTATCQMGVYTGTNEPVTMGSWVELYNGDPPVPWQSTPNYMQFVYIDSITGALPNPFGTATVLGNSATCPMVYVRYA